MSISFDGTNNRVFASLGGVGDLPISLPNHHAFHAYRGAGHVMGTASTATTVIFNTAVLNRGSCYNTSNGRFTAQVAGKYFFGVNGMNTVETSGDHMLRIEKNGNVYNITNPGGNVSSVGFGLSAVIDLAVNDYVTVSHYDSDTNSGLYASGGVWNGFCGFLIG
jgi:hypothetical protein